MRKFLNTFLLNVGTLVVVIILLSFGAFIALFQEPPARISKDSILVLRLDGIILDGREFLEDLEKYRDDDNIKGVLVQVNSPGGVVGPSQEIYQELKRVRDELQKPVVVSCEALAASGAYYAAMGASKVVTNPGSMLGSIGVLMEFANLQRLYDWAKIERYALTSGPFKNSGAEYKPMTEEEKKLFQGLIDEIYGQFKATVIKERKLEPQLVAQYADGRVFTGDTAVKLGFADQLGGYSDALRVVGELAGIKGDPEVFKPPKKHGYFSDFIAEYRSKSRADALVERLVLPDLKGKALYIWPGAL